MFVSSHKNKFQCSKLFTIGIPSMGRTCIKYETAVMTSMTSGHVVPQTKIGHCLANHLDK